MLLNIAEYDRTTKNRPEAVLAIAGWFENATTVGLIVMLALADETYEPRSLYVIPL